MKTKVLNEFEAGFELTDISQVVKAMELGLNIIGEEGSFDYPQFYTNENGDEDERDPTEAEIIQRISEYLTADKGKVFATILLYNHKIVEDTDTILQSRFHVMQDVYFLYHNRITKAKVVTICLTANTNWCSELRHYPRIKVNEWQDEIKCDRSFAILRGNGREYQVYLSDIFSTKTELANHLIDETGEE